MKLSDSFEHIARNRIAHILKTKRDARILRTCDTLFNTLSVFEKIVLYTLMTLVSAGVVWMLYDIHIHTTTLIPRAGGTLTEGVIGSPRFINPLLAQSDTDRDLVALVYSGLMRPTGDGTLTVDLAKRYSISDDGLTYSFVLRDDARFHDGTPVTANDVAFTVALAQDSALKSPKRADWDGVTVETINDREIRFTLSKPYAPFLENTTLGILPKHLWHNISVQEFPFSTFNTTPIGAGAFEIAHIDYDASGIPKSYTLAAFDDYVLGAPFLHRLTMRFYPNESLLKDAWVSGAVESVGSVSTSFYEDAENTERATLVRAAFPRIFAVFFNQNNNRAFVDKAVRRALNEALDKQAIIDTVLNGHGSVLDSPIPPGILSPAAATATRVGDAQTRMKNARTTLADNGWEWDDEIGVWKSDDTILSFSLTTANTPELKNAAQMIADTWSAAGIPVTLNFFESGDLNQNVIRPRDYDALLFGEVVGRSMDLFAFWHSSQKDDPGLNIAMYTNATADALLKKARETHDAEDRTALYAEFADEIAHDTPAVFLYTPDFLYILPRNIQGTSIALVNNPSERFANVHEWYIHTQRVWNFFVKN